jgi:hypothetical protein
MSGHRTLPSLGPCAIANAAGVRLRDLPVTAERIKAAIGV